MPGNLQLCCATERNTHYFFFPWSGSDLKFKTLFFVEIGSDWCRWEFSTACERSEHVDFCFQTKESVEIPKLLTWGRCETLLVK